MRIFLAGASGVLGRRITALLVQHGHEVVGLTRRVETAGVIESLGARAVVADVYDSQALSVAVTSAQPDVVMHQLTDLAAGDRRANAKVRTVGTRHLVNAALASDVPRMIAQSIAWAYEPGERPAAETTPLDLASAGDRLDTVNGIAALESAVAELPEPVILRYGVLYGPDTWYAPDGSMAAAARAGTLLCTSEVSSFVHVEDAAAAAVAALTWPSGPVNVCDDEPATGFAWLPVFCTSVGAGAPGHSDTGAPWARGADNALYRARMPSGLRHHSWRSGFAVT